MKTRSLITTVVLLVLSGCSGEVIAPTHAEDQWSLETLELTPAQVVQNSLAAFEAQGMTEKVFSGGDNYILTYEPGETFVAALYNESFDDVIPVDQPELFTVYAAHLLTENPEVNYVVTDCGFDITAPDAPGMSVCVENDLIVSGHALDDSWNGTFSYLPDQDILAMLDASN